MNKATTPEIHHHTPFGFHTSQEEAKQFMVAHPLTHYPIVEHGIFMGNALAEDIYSLESTQSLEELRHDLELFSTTKEATWFDILEIYAKYESNSVPLLDEKRGYLGQYHFSDILNSLSETPFFSEKAVTLTIEKSSQKYSFSEITHVVESNNSTLLGLFLSKIENGMTEIIIKINSDNINEVIQTFRRHDYEILSKHLEDDYTNELQERSNYLNKYLNI